MANILLVEDSIDCRQLVAHYLKTDHQLFSVSDLKGATDWLRSHPTPDLILLDINLPDGQGFHISNLVDEKIPVIYISGENNINVKTMAFKLGAADYIVKPFDPKELKLRVNANLKRAQTQKNTDNLIYFRDFYLDKDNLKAYILKDDTYEDIDLTATEFKILNLLTTNSNKIFSREQVLNKVWDHNKHLVDRIVDKHVCSLRKKMGDIGNHVHSEYGLGYYFSEAA